MKTSKQACLNCFIGGIYFKRAVLEKRMVLLFVGGEKK